VCWCDCAFSVLTLSTAYLYLTINVNVNPDIGCVFLHVSFSYHLKDISLDLKQLYPCFYFTAIGSAFGVLSNPSKRRHYDQGDKFANIRSAPCRRQSYTSGNDNYDFMNGFEGTFPLLLVAHLLVTNFDQRLSIFWRSAVVPTLWFAGVFH
jgi:hypothetical protein